MKTITQSLEELSSSEVFASKDALELFLEKNQVVEEEKQLFYTFFDELNTYKITKNIEGISPAIFDKVLSLKNRYENQTQSTQEVLTQPSETPNFENLRFEGKTGEYFKIWIVNIFLSLVTLGIYSAWAKVRTNRYFYANTYYKDNSFEYTADPKKILKGRILIFLFYALFMFSTNVLLDPKISLAILAVGLLATPWIVTKAIKFKLKNTKYKNVSLRYNGTSKDMYIFYIKHFVLNIITLYLAFPYTLNKFKELVINKSSYGDKNFSYDGKTKGMYVNFLKIFGAYILSAVIIGAIIAITQELAKEMTNNDRIMLNIAMAVSVYVSYIFIFSALKGVYDALIINYTWENTQLQQHPFKSTLSSKKLIGIYTVNTLAILFSLGLLYPWTKVRTLKYKCENFYASIDDNFIAHTVQTSDQSAFGEEAEDFFDIDLGV